MFEEAPVNTGAVQWPDADSAFWTVRSMQIKLHRWAKEDSFRQFGDVFNLVYDPAFLVHAWERVSSNAAARTPGVDRATVAWVESRIGVETFLGSVRALLKSGELRQVQIPKARKTPQAGYPHRRGSGGPGKHQGGVGTHFRGGFQPCSYGFRPNRRAQDAIAEIHLAEIYRQKFQRYGVRGKRTYADST